MSVTMRKREFQIDQIAQSAL